MSKNGRIGRKGLKMIRVKGGKLKFKLVGKRV